MPPIREVRLCRKINNLTSQSAARSHRACAPSQERWRFRVSRRTRSGPPWHRSCLRDISTYIRCRRSSSAPRRGVARTLEAEIGPSGLAETASESATRCSRPAFIRCAGTSHLRLEVEFGTNRSIKPSSASAQEQTTRTRINFDCRRRRATPPGICASSSFRDAGSLTSGPPASRRTPEKNLTGSQRSALSSRR
jgi:hypothetical protein